MFKKYTSSLWSLNLPQNWDISSDEDCVTFQSKPPVGVLQVSAYSKDSAITVQDVQEFMQSHIKAEKNVPFTKNHSALNLDAILNYTGIPEEPQPHNALTGALSHGEVASRLLYDKKLLPEFEKFDIPWLK
mgnify:CR=1 FL=1